MINLADCARDFGSWAGFGFPPLVLFSHPSVAVRPDPAASQSWFWTASWLSFPLEAFPVSAIMFLCLHLCGCTDKETGGEF